MSIDIEYELNRDTQIDLLKLFIILIWYDIWKFVIEIKNDIKTTLFRSMFRV